MWERGTARVLPTETGSWRWSLLHLILALSTGALRVVCLGFVRLVDRLVSYLLRDGNGNVVHRQSSLSEQILAHISEGSGRIDRITSHTVPLQVRSRIATLKWEERSKKVVYYNYSHASTALKISFARNSQQPKGLGTGVGLVCVCVEGSKYPSPSLDPPQPANRFITVIFLPISSSVWP